MIQRIRWNRQAMLSMLVLAAVSVTTASGQQNQLTEAEKKDGWVLLFNGRDFTGWHRGGKGYGGWEVKDGAICRIGKGGMLWSDEQYEDFVLKIEWNCTPGCNSGVFVRTANKGNPVQTGIEIQVLDDKGKRPDKHTNGAVYDVQAPSKQVTKPAGEWNRAVITCEGSKIEVEMNGEQIIDIDLDDWTEAGKNPDGTKNKFKTAYKDMARKGHLGLQDHGKTVSFRNVKLKPLER